ncbi:hypothetical protein CFK37_02500 [Virgibacillus phasianinus]|uniref:VOC domain-containing protein n=1 Tax=Virgibacillus phasianinus TaxID=2017483 RepID=A0A220TZD3_9BACI|nr:VOC family protein [Virgibacillus phasianinus]ASK61140.1 hypothetical protein CFK37_02500 [Virgibacillus phasianinus]
MTKGIIHHVELYVSDLKRSVEFWSWFLQELGYQAFQEWDGGKSFKLGETYIVFVQADERFLDVPYHRKGIGLNHLAFHAESREHVDAITSRLKRNEITILYPDKHPFAGGEGHYAVYFEDPDRVKVELVAPNI